MGELINEAVRVTYISVNNSTLSSSYCPILSLFRTLASPSSASVPNNTISTRLFLILPSFELLSFIGRYSPITYSRD